MKGRQPETIGSILGGLGGSFGLQGVLESGRIWRGWEDIVGVAIAAHCEPTSLREGILRVRADSPAWCTEIGYLAEEIKTRANSVAGRQVVRDVRVWTGPEPFVPKVSPEGRRRGPDPQERPEREGPEEALIAAREAWAKRFGRRG